MRLSNQAMGAIMMALQKSIMEQSDIVEVLEGFNFQLDEREELLITNPPTFKMNFFGEETKFTTGSD